nr:MAG TPA: hypothetical protein [Caudoviricetes sp.]
MVYLHCYNWCRGYQQYLLYHTVQLVPYSS